MQKKGRSTEDTNRDENGCLRMSPDAFLLSSAHGIKQHVAEYQHVPENVEAGLQVCMIVERQGA